MLKQKPSILDGRNVPLYRVSLACKIGRDALEGKTEMPQGVTPLEWAVFNLLHAVEDMGKALEQMDRNIGRGET